MKLQSQSHSDGDLLRLIVAGREEAFLEFYRRHQAAVFRFALHMSGKTEIAEEVTQDVFMAVINAARDFDPARGTAPSLLYGIARNYVRRSMDRNRFYVTSLDDPGNRHPTPVSPAPDVSIELARRERVDLLRQSILALPPAYREVVVLCDLQEVSYEEAAEILGCALGTIRSRLHRARALLVEKMRARERCVV